MQVKALESEIEDLHGEFELDRLDYLETIRKQDQQIKLLSQILDKVQPAIKKVRVAWMVQSVSSQTHKRSTKVRILSWIQQNKIPISGLELS